VTGGPELVEIKISPEVVDADDVEMLEDLVIVEGFPLAVKEPIPMLALERGRVRLEFTEGGSRKEGEAQKYGQEENSQEKINQEEGKEDGYSRFGLHQGNL
jgi:molybdopterin-guanine dinucleotide biosynthesis protein